MAPFKSCFDLQVMKARRSADEDYDLSPTRQYTVVSKMPKGMEESKKKKKKKKIAKVTGILPPLPVLPFFEFEKLACGVGCILLGPLSKNKAF
jgi:hypothetical protein